MQNLNLPAFDYQLKSNENKTLIFDIIRKKYVVLTPEEWVRQHFVNYLISVKNYPVSLIAIEKQIQLHKVTKRFDILIFSNIGKPYILIECKAPNVQISQNTFDQIARYNSEIDAEFLIVTNGLDHFCCQMDFDSKKYIFLNSIPDFQSK
ncbi:MAG: type I restriction enzyme HsdR N-terminal domain-containing protein [Polaribacter sp.]|jgi:hypothetical protein